MQQQCLTQCFPADHGVGLVDNAGANHPTTAVDQTPVDGDRPVAVADLVVAVVVVVGVAVVQLLVVLVVDRPFCEEENGEQCDDAKKSG